MTNYLVKAENLSKHYGKHNIGLNITETIVIFPSISHIDMIYYQLLTRLYTHLH